MKKLPTLDDLIEHLTVYEHSPDSHLFVAGPPGSGKTSLAVYRAQFLARLGKSVVLVTKNRMLAALASELGGGTLETTTMNTLVSRDHARRVGVFAPEITPYVYDWDKIASSYDAKGLLPALDHIVIDEGQNLAPGFFRWARRHGARTLTVFADEDQAIDEYRSSLGDIAAAADLDDPIRLTDNHRNTPEIAAVAEHFHESKILPPALVKKGPGGAVPQLLSLASRDDLVSRIVTRFRNRREAIGVVVQGKKEAVALYEAIRATLPSTDRVDVYTSDKAEGTERAIRLLDSGITVLTGESVIGLEFDAVFLLDLARSLPCASPADSRRMYMLCSRARDALVLVHVPVHLTARQVAALPQPPILVR